MALPSVPARAPRTGQVAASHKESPMKLRIQSGSRAGALLVLLGIAHSANVFAQSDAGAVTILGRTFSCSSSTSCSAVSAETSPYFYVSNRDVGFSALINRD